MANFFRGPAPHSSLVLGLLLVQRPRSRIRLPGQLSPGLPHEHAANPVGERLAGVLGGFPD